MSTTDTTMITASQWLAVRDRVKNVVKAGASPQTRDTTVTEITERLLTKGYIDIEAIVEEIDTEKREREDRNAADQKRREQEKRDQERLSRGTVVAGQPREL